MTGNAGLVIGGAMCRETHGLYAGGMACVDLSPLSHTINPQTVEKNRKNPVRRLFSLSKGTGF